MARQEMHSSPGVDASGVADELDGLYARHLLAVHWCRAVSNRLEGQALFLLGDELDEVLEQNLSSARKLADRVGELGGAVAGDPRELVARAGRDGFDIPEGGDLGGILASALDSPEGDDRGLRGSASATAGDELTHRLLLSLVRHEVARESDLESAMARGA
jgi:ferritin-like protein